MCFLYFVLTTERNNNMIEITDANFNDNVLASDKLAVVDFYTPWCAPCKKMLSTLNYISEERDDVNFFKINAEENVNTVRDYSVSGVPIVLLFKNGTIVKKVVGLFSKDSLIKTIEKHL